MNEKQSVESICLNVFAGVSAIVTHEIRNGLAIINESAGFLEDLVEMAGPDGALPGARVKKVTSSSLAQVTRANALMTNLNTFAHSFDKPVANIRVADTLALMVALTKRRAVARNVTVELITQKDFELTMSVPALESFLYIALTGLYDALQSGGVIRIELLEYKGVMVMRFTGEPDLNTAIIASDHRLAVLAHHLRFTLSIHESSIDLRFA